MQAKNIPFFQLTQEMTTLLLAPTKVAKFVNDCWQRLTLPELKALQDTASNTFKTITLYFYQPSLSPLELTRIKKLLEGLFKPLHRSIDFIKIADIKEIPINLTDCTRKISKTTAALFNLTQGTTLSSNITPMTTTPFHEEDTLIQKGWEYVMTAKDALLSWWPSFNQTMTAYVNQTTINDIVNSFANMTTNFSIPAITTNIHHTVNNTSSLDEHIAAHNTSTNASTSTSLSSLGWVGTVATSSIVVIGLFAKWLPRTTPSTPVNEHALTPV